MLTRCPQCETIFRVSKRDLAAAKGKVRCGSCKAVFNAEQQSVKSRKDLIKTSIIPRSPRPHELLNNSIMSTSDEQPDHPQDENMFTESAEIIIRKPETEPLDQTTETKQSAFERHVIVKPEPQAAKPKSKSEALQMGESPNIGITFDTVTNEISNQSVVKQQEPISTINLDTEVKQTEKQIKKPSIATKQSAKESHSNSSKVTKNIVNIKEAVSFLSRKAKDVQTAVKKPSKATKTDSSKKKETKPTKKNTVSNNATNIEKPAAQLKQNVAKTALKVKKSKTKTSQANQLNTEADVTLATQLKPQTKSDRKENKKHKQKKAATTKSTNTTKTVKRIKTTAKPVNPKKHKTEIRKPSKQQPIIEEIELKAIDTQLFTKNDNKDLNTGLILTENNIALKDEEVSIHMDTMDIPFVLRDSLEELDLPKRSLQSTMFMLFSMLILIGVLLLQTIVFKSVELSQNYPELKPIIKNTCGLFPCRYTGSRNVKKIQLLSRDIRVHPNTKGALLVTATIVSRTSFQQPYPNFRVTLSNLAGNIVARRYFTPTDYLRKLSDSLRLMPPGVPVKIALEVVDPGKDAINFDFTILASQ
ncbi:MAG: hypothetical protein BMS9Abin31_1159 [Gammaproteobacteria bacterium]|nr:MAG: hypothetical protein BMS9Abin31_1159 [Gammaproteobacteria bacterium]